ncbi:MAG: HD domain-containing protein [bacterium]|nr:HD domain-containing protein [bacterium]
MEYKLIFTLILIFLGIIFLFICNLISHSMIKKSEWFLSINNSKIFIYYRLYQVLVILFLIGYVFIFCFILRNIPVNNMIFLGIALFLGSVFILLGVVIYSHLLSICNKNHKVLAEKCNRVIIRNKKIQKTEDSLIFMLAHLVQLKDYNNEEKHIVKGLIYVQELLKELSKKPKFSSILTDKYVANLLKATPLFDIGKLLVSDSILQKKGKLTESEFKKMQMHCKYGVDLLNKCKENLGFNAFLPTAIQLAYSHHERWDGNGYPCGLKGEEIPLAARIASLINVFDTLRSERSYKSAFSEEKIIKIILEERGKHFDPDIVDAFFAVKDIFFKIHKDGSSHNNSELNC